MLDFLNKKEGAGDGLSVVFDIGGTKTRVAVSRDRRNFMGEPKVVPTPKDFDEGVKLIKKLADDIGGGAPFKAVAGGVPGVLSKDKKTIFKLPHLPEWDGAPFKAGLERVFNVPVYLENDTALNGLGEFVMGAGKGYDIMVYITVSTGVGGVRIVSGKIDPAVFNFEPGHQIINMAETDSENGGRLENYISGPSVVRRFGKYAVEITDEKTLVQLASELAVGLHNAILLWSPDAVVLGGSMITGTNPIPLDKVETKLKELLTMFPEIPVIKKAVLDDFSGLHGSLELIRQNYSQADY